MSNLLTSKGTDTAKTGTNMSTLLTEIIEICKDGSTATRTASQFAEMYSHRNSVFTYKGSPVVNVDVSSGFAFEVFEKSNGSPVLQGYSVNGRAIVTGTTTALGGDSLPEVSATDNGDVLGVVEGEWAKTEIPTPTRLPSAFQEVEYIESSGTQRINTGINPSANTRAIIKESFTDLTTYSLEGLSQSNQFFTWGISSRREYFETRVGGSSAQWQISTVPIDTDVHTWDIQSGSQKIDNVTIATDTMVTASNPLILFARYASDWEYAKARMYSCKIYENGTLIRYFIPCYLREDDTEIGLFDIVNFKYYGNNGTGTFTKGADV